MESILGTVQRAPRGRTPRHRESALIGSSEAQPLADVKRQALRRRIVALVNPAPLWPQLSAGEKMRFQRLVFGGPIAYPFGTRVTSPFFKALGRLRRGKKALVAHTRIELVFRP